MIEAYLKFMHQVPVMICLIIFCLIGIIWGVWVWRKINREDPEHRYHRNPIDEALKFWRIRN